MNRMTDLISRQAAIEVIDAVFPVDPMKSEYAQGIACGAALAKTYVEQLPSAQPEKVCIAKITLSEEQVREAVEKAKSETVQVFSSAQPEIIRCKDCKHWRQQTNYQGAPLSFGFCESDDMWRSLYGETYEVSHIDTDDDFYCGYAERRTDE